jgi:hypothetical protein
MIITSEEQPADPRRCGSSVGSSGKRVVYRQTTDGQNVAVCNVRDS